MGFWEWMGFENPRDSPKTEQPKEGLPKVTDNVRDSGQTFVFGRSNAGEQVDEKAAMQIPTVYACVRLLAESIAALPLHLYRMTERIDPCKDPCKQDRETGGYHDCRYFQSESCGCI